MAYPKFKYHGSKPAKQVATAEEEAALIAEGYGDVYQHQEYPKHLYRDVEGKNEIEFVVAKNPEEEAKFMEDGYREDIDPDFPLASSSRFSH